MFRNYLRVALRSLRQQRIYSLINIVGLTIGIVGAILITTFVRYELSFEDFIPDVDRIHRVVQLQKDNMYLGSNQFAVTQAPLAEVLESDVPEVEAATTFDDRSGLISQGDVHAYEQGLEADDHFFQVFRYEIERGDLDQVLSEPGQIVLTRSLAEKLFGEEDAVGRVVGFGGTYDDTKSYTVSGILADIPKNSHIQFSFIVSILDNDNYVRSQDRWGSSSWMTYFRLRSDQSLEAAKAKIGIIPLTYQPNDNPEENEQYIVQSMKSVHLHSHINFDLAQNGDIRFVYLLSAIGLVILLLACVNYVNLAIATSVMRAKEIGVRKVVGALRRQIIVQFLSQSILTATISVSVSLVATALILPRFAEFVQRDLSFFADGFLGIATMVGVFIIAVGLIGGLYPSFVAARMKPASILKGSSGARKTGSGLRRVLVTAQFAVAVVLIAATFIIFRQMEFVQSQDLGYEREHIVTVRLQDRDLRNRLSDLRQILTANRNVLAVTSSNSLPTRINSTNGVSDWSGHEGDESLKIYFTAIGYDFLDIYEIPIVMGRGFSPDYPADDSLGSYIINETAFKALGWQDLEGKYIKNGSTEHPVVGVVRDFHMHSFRLEVMPLMMDLTPESSYRLSIKIAGVDIPGTVQFLESTLMGMTPFPVEVRFIDDVYTQMYDDDQQLSSTVGLFTILALLIGALGLFGLVAYTAETRTKEIGVRKVLGASVPSILGLFARDYAGLIVIASIVGTPVAYGAMSRWLDQFAYRIDMGAVDFLLSIGLLLMVAGVSMTYQTLRAATADPVKALRYE